MDDSFSFIADLQKREAQIILRVSVLRLNTQRFLAMRDSFAHSSLAEQQVRQTGMSKMVLLGYRNGVDPHGLAIAPIPCLGAGDPHKTNNCDYPGDARKLPTKA